MWLKRKLIKSICLMLRDDEPQSHSCVLSDLQEDFVVFSSLLHNEKGNSWDAILLFMLKMFPRICDTISLSLSLSHTHTQTHTHTMVDDWSWAINSEIAEQNMLPASFNCTLRLWVARTCRFRHVMLPRYCLVQKVERTRTLWYLQNGY